MTLPGFDIYEFLDEIDILIQKSEHKMARLVLQMVAKKLKNIPEDAGFGFGIREDNLDLIEENIFDIEIDFENFFNIDIDLSKFANGIYYFSFFCTFSSCYSN